MDGQPSAVKKVRVAELYERLAALDKMHGPKAARWYSATMRGVAILFALVLLLVPLLWLVNTVLNGYLKTTINVLLTMALVFNGIGILTILVRLVPRAWAPFKRSSRDLDEMLSYERELIAEFRDCEVADLKEVGARIDVELKIATRRISIFVISAAISTLCLTVFSKDHGWMPHWVDESMVPFLFAAFVLMSGFAALMVISMAAQLERISFILTRAADKPS